MYHSNPTRTHSNLNRSHTGLRFRVCGPLQRELQHHRVTGTLYNESSSTTGWLGHSTTRAPAPQGDWDTLQRELQHHRVTGTLYNESSSTTGWLGHSTTRAPAPQGEWDTLQRELQHHRVTGTLWSATGHDKGRVKVPCPTEQWKHWPKPAAQITAAPSWPPPKSTHVRTHTHLQAIAPNTYIWKHNVLLVFRAHGDRNTYTCKHTFSVILITRIDFQTHTFSLLYTHAHPHACAPIHTLSLSLSLSLVPSEGTHITDLNLPWFSTKSQVG